MNKLGLRITNNGREAYVANPNHDWELHTVDFNACLLTLDNIDEGDGLIILSHDSGGCYVGFVHLLKQGFNGLCIAASIFVPENLSVGGNAMSRLVFEVRKHLQGAVLDTAALDRLFATEYPDKDFIPDFQPQHSKTIACRIEEWNDETLDQLLDSRCLFQPAYAQHRATLLIDSDSEIICDGIDITAEPIVIPEPAPVVEVVEPHPETAFDSVVKEQESQAETDSEPVSEEMELGHEVNPDPEIMVTPGSEFAGDSTLGPGGEQGLEVVVLEEKVDEESLEVVVEQEGEGSYDNNTESEIVELDVPHGQGGFVAPADSTTPIEPNEGVEVVSVYPIPPNVLVPPPPPDVQQTPASSSVATHVNDAPSSSSSSNKLMVFLVLLALGIAVVFLVNHQINSSESHSNTYEPEYSASETPIYQTEEASAVTEEVSLNQQIYEAYVEKLESLASSVGGDGYGDCGYFLYDITGDGIPELWVKCGTCEADYMLYVYRYGVGRLELMHSTGAGHSSFYCGEDYVLQVMAHMGEAWWYKIELSGSELSEELVYEESDIESSDEYAQPVEPDAHMYNYDETWPIAGALE